MVLLSLVDEETEVKYLSKNKWLINACFVLFLLTDDVAT